MGEAARLVAVAIDAGNNNKDQLSRPIAGFTPLACLLSYLIPERYGSENISGSLPVLRDFFTARSAQAFGGRLATAELLAGGTVDGATVASFQNSRRVREVAPHLTGRTFGRRESTSQSRSRDH